MHLTTRSLLVSFAGCFLYSTLAIANDVNNAIPSETNTIFPLGRDNVAMCVAPKNLSKKEQEKQKEKEDNEPILIQADNAEAKNNSKAVYRGNVHIIKGNQEIKADSITLHQKENITIAEGNVNYSSLELRSTSDKVTTDLTTKDTTMINTSYQMTCEPIRGQASRVLKTGQEIYQLEDSSFTSCPEGDNSWRLKASDIELDRSEEWATFYHARFEVLDVPIFYLPYVTVPVGDKRKSGLLIPSGGFDSKNGVELSIPIYWNLAPNYDLTTTLNYMEKRGTQLQTEFRYLTEFGSGNLTGEYLANDDKFEEKGARWGIDWTHEGIYKTNWKFSAEYAKVSDIDYFQDLDSDIGDREEGNLEQSGEVAYRTDSWDLALRVRDFQVLVDNSYPYRMTPQLEYNYYAPQFYDELDFNFHSHVSRFITDDPDAPSDATRVHLEPKLSLPLGNSWWSLTPEASLLYTYYNQTFDDNNSLYSDLAEHTSRTLPEVRINGSLYLDSTYKLFDEYLQTIEPKLQYLYVPDVDQSEIYGGTGGGGYDSNKLQLDYYGLFRDREYSGVDYIAEANQFSFGATSRFYDGDYKERMNVSFGQILYLQDTSNSYSDDGEAGFSTWAIETDFNYDDYLFYHGGVQIDSGSNDLQVANNTFEYRHNAGYIQLNYRYVSRDYIENSVELDDLDQITQYGIHQAGFLTQYKVNKNWQVKAQYFYDTKESYMLESLLGLTYLTDCWSFGLTYSDQIVASNSGLNIGTYDPEYESNIMFSFALRGLGTNTAITSGSESNALDYGRPFYLNN